FRETTRRVFAGVPRLYGFSTVAARGERTSVQLARYFTARADYAHHLVTTWDDPSPNRTLEAAFRHTGMTQVSRLAPDDPGARGRRPRRDLPPLRRRRSARRPPARRPGPHGARGRALVRADCRGVPERARSGDLRPDAARRLRGHPGRRRRTCRGPAPRRAAR